MVSSDDDDGSFETCKLPSSVQFSVFLAINNNC